jgi:uncharacterized membrane-anchored protein YitT (DUF2179 family)
MYLDYLIWLTSITMLMGKALDFHSTVSRIQVTAQERNKLARWLMRRTGMKTGLFLMFLIACGLIAFAHFYVLYYCEYAFEKWVFIIAGLVVNIVTGGVVHHNYTGKNNAITRYMLRHSGRFYD